MYYQGEVEKNDRRKIITVATAIVVVVLILIVSIIVVAARKSGDNVSTTETSSSVVEEPKEEPKPETKPVETVTVSTAPATNTKAVVDTGPEDTIPMILSFGSLTTAGTAYLMSLKRKA